MVARKLNQQMRNFCHAYLETGVGADAYQAAYPGDRTRKTNYELACRLLKEPRVQEYLASIRAESREQVKEAIKETAEKQIAELNDVLQRALAGNQLGVATNAIMGKARIMGNITDKKDITIGMRPDEARSIIENFLGSRK